MKRSSWKIGTLILVAATLGIALAVGPGADANGPAGASMRGARPVMAAGHNLRGQLMQLLSEVLGKDAADLRAEFARGGLRGLIQSSGMEPLELRRKIVEAALGKLDQAYANGKLSQLRYQEAKARLQARLLSFETPTLAELVSRSGGDVKALQAQLTALRQQQIAQLLKLGVISREQAETMKAQIGRQVERLLNRPAGLAAHPALAGELARRGAQRKGAQRHGAHDRPAMQRPSGPRR